MTGKLGGWTMAQYVMNYIVLDCILTSETILA